MKRFDSLQKVEQVQGPKLGLLVDLLGVESDLQAFSTIVVLATCVADQQHWLTRSEVITVLLYIDRVDLTWLFQLPLKSF